MIRPIVSCLNVGLLVFFTFAFVDSASADDDVKKRVLNPMDKSVKRLESNQTFGGYTKTRLFYTFEKECVILRLTIDNKTDKFPIAAELFTFKMGTNAKSLAKWLNNQTSDALFGDAPRPKSKKNLGEGVGKVTSKKIVGDADVRGMSFDKYSVEFQLSKMGAVDGYSFKTFSDKATVYVKKK